MFHTISLPTDKVLVTVAALPDVDDSVYVKFFLPIRGNYGNRLGKLS